MTSLGVPLRLALRALSQNKMRAALTVLGILIGVAAVIAMTALGAGTKARMANQMAALGVNMLVVFPGATATGGVRGAQGTAAGLTESDARAIVKEVPSIADAAPVMSASAQAVARERNAATRVTGTTPAYFRVRNWSVSEGALFDDTDLRATAKTCLIGETVRRDLFPGRNPIGESLRVGTLPCRVIGVLASKGQSSFGQDQDDVVIVPLTTFRAHVARLQGDQVNAIFLSAQAPSVMHRAEAATKALLRQRHHLGEGVENDFTVRNLQELASTLNAQQSALTFLLLVVASISLLVGGIGIMNIMLVSVTERTREIGIRLAVGARSRDILAQFLVESLVLAVLGGVAGFVLGAAASVILARVTEWEVAIQPGSAVLAIIVAGGVGVVFGYFPAARAAHLDPIVALRHE